MIGRVFSYFTVVALERTHNLGKAWRCQCVCGKQRVYQSNELLSGRRKSCGCKRWDAARQGKCVSKTHGMTKTPTYKSWHNMKSRCYNTSDPYYSKYGGRGIKVCARWVDSFENFLSDIGERPAGKSLDRIDINGDYSPENCRWATTKEQNRNRSDTRWVTLNGETRSLAEWCEIRGVPGGLVRKRIAEMGWPAEQAFNTPSLGVGRRRK